MVLLFNLSSLAIQKIFLFSFPSIYSTLYLVALTQLQYTDRVYKKNQKFLLIIGFQKRLQFFTETLTCLATNFVVKK